MYHKVKEYLNISRQELRGLIVVFFLMIIVYLFPYIWEQLFYQPLEIKIETLQPLVNDIETYSNKHKYYRGTEDLRHESENIKLFKFDPNHLPLEDWVRLGLSEKQAATIKKYEAKGGKFYTKADVKKMYSISEKQYLKLEPYIDIPARPAKYEKRDFNRDRKSIENKKVSVNINQADSLALLEVKGIGPAFASRILRYRNRLGGFVNKAQLLEVYGVDSAKFNQIEGQLVIDKDHITYLDINNATFDDLKKFPYLSFKQMNAIIAYRKQHGNYKSLTDFSKIVILNQEIIDKIAPYIKF